MKMPLLKKSIYTYKFDEVEKDFDVYEVYKNINPNEDGEYLLTVLEVYSKVGIYFSLNGREITIHKAYKKDAYDPEYKLFEIDFDVFINHVFERDFKWFMSLFIEEVLADEIEFDNVKDCKF